MAWSFRRRVKVIPGVYFNLSKGGISTSIGVRGAHINFNKKGIILQTRIPGTGISDRQRISFNDAPPKEVYNPEVTPQPSILDDYTDNTIFSVDVDEITSKDMQGVKESILAAHTQRKELNLYQTEVTQYLKKAQSQLSLSYWLLYGFVFKDHCQKLKIDIAAQNEALLQIQNQLLKSYVQFNYEFEPA